MKYLERIKKSPEEQLTESQEYQASQNRLQLDSDLLATRQELKLKERELDQLLSAEILSTYDIILYQDNIEGLEKGQSAIKKLIEELF